MVEELFKQYFEQEKDNTDDGNLLEAAVRAGLSEAEAKELLSSDVGGKEVDEEVMEARRRRHALVRRQEW